MKKRRWLILAVIFLMAATLSCGLFGGSEETPEAAAPTQPAGDSSETESEAPPQDAGESQPSQPSAPQANLGETYRSEMGGYAFQAIPGYEVEEAFGFASMTAPGADPEKGPTFLLIGGTNDEPATTEELFSEFMEKPDEEDVVILEQREVTVDGKPGILAELEGPDDTGETMRVRVVIVAVSDVQQFTMLATAPMDRWDEVTANFDSVLDSVSFFEPQEMSLDDLDDMIDETPEDLGGEDTGDSGDYDFSDLEALSDFPSQASDLPPGGFAVLLADPNGTLVLVSGEQAQPQPAGDEYVVVLSGIKPENTVTLFLPRNAAADMLMMVPYDANATTHAPGATIQLGSTLYTSTDGIIMVEATDGNTISGSMFFVAVDESGAELSVSGFFNALPLTP
jgi:hypothetical protein